MRIAVIGAGIVGVTTAYELVLDGHEVVVFDRRGSVAEETSFANAGVVAPGYVAPWASPGMPRKVLGHLFGQYAPVRLSRPYSTVPWSWVWRWWRACRSAEYRSHRSRMYRLAHYSQKRLQAVTRELNLSYEQSSGYLVLLRTRAELGATRDALRLLAEFGVNFRLVDADRARVIEPGLNPQTPLQAAVHLPDAQVGNCRQFAQLMRAEAHRLGVDFRLQHSVLGLVPGRRPQVVHRSPQSPGTDLDESFDAVVVCAALGAPALLEPLGVRIPLAAVHGYSITAPLRVLEAHPDLGPRAGLMDEKYKVAISRLGQRVRAAGSAEIGGRADDHHPAALATLHRVLDDWFPGCAQSAQVQTWKGARPMLPDGPPVLGESGVEGIWLNLGHGSSGWALACGSARLVTDLLARRPPAVDAEGLGVERLRR
jgi:D-amino-acid dehydrogenase